MEVVTTHKNCDFDALASVIAATLLYPNAVGVIPKAVNPNVAKFLSTHKTAFNLVLPKEVVLADVNRLIVVDTDQWRRIERLDRLREREDVEIWLWDHHHGGDIDADWRCQEEVGATVTLLVREMKARGMSLNALASTVLLIGLYEDTGHLSFPSTTAEDAAAAAFLLENQADLHVASFFLTPPYEEIEKDILFTMMQNSETYQHLHYKIVFNTLNLRHKPPMLASIVSMYRKIISADAVFITVINDKKSCTVIGRSGVEVIDVGAILQVFGGGGHPAAGSATIKFAEYEQDEIRTKIIEQITTAKISGATVADLMSFPVTMVAGDTPMDAVRDIMQEQNIRGVLVGTPKNLEGIIVLWDLKKFTQEKQWRSPVKAFMARTVATIAPDVQPARAAQLMVEKNIGHLPVVHHGTVIGIVTRTDILNYFYGLLPE
jgi:tRNA nucleotidyltransferase (CCA-adding enzyme)